MIAFHSSRHEEHAPPFEYHRAEIVPCFETPARIRIVCDELAARGHRLREPDQDSASLLPLVHTPRYLAFLGTAWDQWLETDRGRAEVQPFPAVWPVRTLRGDVERPPTRR